MEEEEGDGVQGFEYLEDVIARAHENLAAYKSGSDIEKPIFISEGVALDFGNLNKNTFQSLPDDLKIAIAACHKVIQKGKKATYEATLAGIMQNPVLKPNTDSFINRLDKFMPEITAWWDIFGKSETVKMNELNGWFLNLITDAEFLAITQLQAGSALSMAKATQLIFKNLRGSCGPKKEGMIRRDIINMGVLQYPQAEGGHFLLHHVHLFGWVDCGNADRNGGITGEYTKREFTARQKIITKLSDTSRGKALTFIGAVFDGVEPKPKTEKPTGESTTTASSSSSASSSNVLTSTAAAFTTAATITTKPGDNDDEDDVCAE